jgi:hypothetical protein
MTPVNILIGMPVLSTPHPGEESLCTAVILILPVLIDPVIFILSLVVAWFSLTDTDGSVIKIGTIDQWVIPVLIPVQIFKQ